MGRVQSDYEINPELGFAGAHRGAEQPASRRGGHLCTCRPAATRTPRPGDALYYDTTEDQWAIPTSRRRSRCSRAGILSYRADTVQNASSILEFADEAEIEVATMGVWWAVAGSAMEYDAIVAWDRADFQWDTRARQTDIAELALYPMVCKQRGGVATAGDLFKLALGMGRVI